MLTRYREQALDLFAPLADLQKIGLAVSGGADSMALMVLGAAWAAALDRAVIVYTLDHGLRPEARSECALVAETARRLGLECRQLRWTGEKPAAGIQAAARQARYRLIGEAMQADGVQMLLTAHHRDDQAETVLMRLAHGSGLAGLGGMRAFSEAEGVRLFRPFLTLDKTALGRICQAADIHSVNDPSNDDLSYERVRWRQALTGELAPPGLTAGRLSQFAMRMARADASLAAVAQQAFDQMVRVDGMGVVWLPLAFWTHLDGEIGIRVLQKCVRLAGGGSRPGGLGDVEALQAQLLGDTEMQRRTLHGAIVEVRDGVLVLTREAGRMSQGPVALPPNTSIVWDQRFEISAGLTAPPYHVVSGKELTRVQVEGLIGGQFAGTMAAVRAAPVVLSEAGEIAALGTHVFHPALRVSIPSSPQ